MFRKVKKIFKKMAIGIMVFVLVLFVIGALFVNLSPEFGGSPSKEDIKKYELSGNYEKGKFMNLTPTSMDMDFGNMTGVLKKFIQGVPNNKPKFKIPVEKIDSLNLVQNDTLTRLILVWALYILVANGREEYSY